MPAMFFVALVFLFVLIVAVQQFVLPVASRVGQLNVPHSHGVCG